MSAVSLYISNPFRQSRELVDNIDLSGDVSTFKNTITKTVGIEPDKQGMLLASKLQKLQGFPLNMLPHMF